MEERSTLERRRPDNLLFRHLPAIYQEHESLAAFLQPFEWLLIGGAGSPGESQGMREMIARLPALLDPFQTPEEFLPWLGSWVALALREDLEVSRKRKLVASAVYLFSLRGTRQGVEQLLSIATGGEPTIEEPEIVNLRVGVQAVVGSTTRLGRDLPHFFHVSIRFPDEPSGEDSRKKLTALVRSTLDLAKPAHTYYKLTLEFPSTEPKPASGAKAAGRKTNYAMEAPKQ